MRWVRYEVDGNETFGIVEGEQIIDVSGDPFDGYERRPLPARLAIPNFSHPSCRAHSMRRG